MKSLKTVNFESVSNYLERGSRFVGSLRPMKSVADFKINLKEIRQEHKSSSHVCSAYRFLNNNILEEKGADDGEPSGSAGLPILNELKRSALINVGVFVVRYFGGKKLGVAGLVHCYSESAKLCINDSKLINWIPSKNFLLTHDYHNLNKVDFLIKKYSGKLLNREFNLHVNSIINIQDDFFDEFKSEMNSQQLLDMSIAEIK